MSTISCSGAEYLQHVEDSDGICLACHEWTCGGCEPDAERYECEGCGERRVMGAENALVCGHLDLTEAEPVYLLYLEPREDFCRGC